MHSHQSAKNAMLRRATVQRPTDHSHTPPWRTCRPSLPPSALDFGGLAFTGPSYHTTGVVARSTRRSHTCTIPVSMTWGSTSKAHKMPRRTIENQPWLVGPEPNIIQPRQAVLCGMQGHAAHRERALCSLQAHYTRRCACAPHCDETSGPDFPCSLHIIRLCVRNHCAWWWQSDGW